jgi:hypothetical protein
MTVMVVNRKFIFNDAPLGGGFCGQSIKMAGRSGLR